MRNKKANILTETVIFIVLNVVFFSVMILFIYMQSSSVHLEEERVAKQIALLIDAAKPGTEIEINLEKFFAKADKGIDMGEAIEIDNKKNLVIVRGSEDSFYEYGFFNDCVEVLYPYGAEGSKPDGSDENVLFIKIGEVKDEQES